MRMLAMALSALLALSVTPAMGEPCVCLPDGVPTPTITPDPSQPVDFYACDCGEDGTQVGRVDRTCKEICGAASCDRLCHPDAWR